MGGEGGVEDGAVGGREARTLGFQREPVVEDLWVAPGPEQDYVNVVFYQLSSVSRCDHWGKLVQS